MTDYMDRQIIDPRDFNAWMLTTPAWYPDLRWQDD